MDRVEPFRFYTERHLVELTGLRAQNLPQLLALLREVPGSSIFYHTHQQFLAHHFEKPVVYNDFAVWVGDAVREEALAEKLAAIDMLASTSVRQLRETIIQTIEDYMAAIGGRWRDCLPGEEYHFCMTRSFVMPLGVTAQDPADFFSKLPSITNNSLYFHFLASRLRLERPTSDFSHWLAACGQRELAHAIDTLDPYTSSLDELKSEIVRFGKIYGVY